MDETEILHCQSCGSVIGAVNFINGVGYLHIGGLLLREVHGICLQCKAGFHYDISERALAQLVQHVLDLRRGGV